jgi:hypoxanthine phosphoribosyltransferase
MSELNFQEWEEWLTLLYSLLPEIADYYGADLPRLVIVAALNGGAVPAEIIAGELGIKDVRAVSIGRQGELRYFCWPKGGDIGSVRDRRVLVVEDDVRQGGRSPLFLGEELRRRGAAEVRVACVYKHVDASGVMFFAQEVTEVPTHPWKPANPGDR